jgi:glycosyltransferase involved in cell wall biosynthesis
MISGYGAANLDKHGAFYNTLEEFHKHWDRIDIIAPKGEKDSQYFGNVFLHPSPWPLWLQPWWILKKGAQLYREQRFSVFTVHDYPPFYNGIGARWLHRHIKVPYMSEIMHVPGHPRAGSFKEQVYKHLMRWSIGRITCMAKAVRVINRDVMSFLRSAGVRDDQLTLISAMYIDTGVFKPMDLPVIHDLIFVGRLEENKGIMLFLDAVRQSGLRALIVGDGPLKRKVQDYVDAHHLAGKVAIHGWARDSSEIARLMNQSRALVMPSYNEGGPRVVLEAMACGVPVLATPVGIVPDVIKDRESGVLIDWNASDIAAKAGELLANPALYETCRSNGLTVASQHERTQAIKNYADVLQSLT